MSRRWIRCLAFALGMVVAAPSPAGAACGDCLIGSVSGSGIHAAGEFEWAGSVTAVGLAGTTPSLVIYSMSATGVFGGLRGRGTMNLFADTGAVVHSFEFGLTGNPNAWALSSGTAWAGTYVRVSGGRYVGTLIHQDD